MSHRHTHRKLRPAKVLHVAQYGQENQHRRFVWRLSICSTVLAGTAFLPLLPGAAKSSTFAPAARRRLYTLPREHRHRSASSPTEKKSWWTDTQRRFTISRIASSES